MEKTCGNCFWFDGGPEDGIQFCDELETHTKADSFACRKWKENNNNDVSDDI